MVNLRNLICRHRCMSSNDKMNQVICFNKFSHSRDGHLGAASYKNCCKEMFHFLIGEARWKERQLSAAHPTYESNGRFMTSLFLSWPHGAPQTRYQKRRDMYKLSSQKCPQSPVLRILFTNGW